MKSINMRSSVDIIVCVHNSHDDVKLCLNSVMQTLGDEDRLIIVDDGSAEETKALCETVSSQNPESTLLIRRSEGSGFCRAANAGMKRSDKETVVLLNSDTIVSKGWIDKLHSSLHSHPRIGLAGPLSNAGGWQSIPELPGKNTSNADVKSDENTLLEINQFCENIAENFTYPIVEQVNGFCLAIKRSVLDTIGLFDEERFPMGYGEESDLNLRAQNAGFFGIIALDCFIYHAKTKSYTSDQRKQLAAKGRVHLNTLYTAKRVDNAVIGAKDNPSLLEIREISKQRFLDNDWITYT